MTTAPAPPADLDGVLARMRGLAAVLPPDDGVAVFNGVYLAVTEEIGRRLAAGGFADPGTAAALAVRFAGRYLDAVGRDGSGGRRAPDCWRLLLRRRSEPGVHALQFALAGINAHVGHDLPLAVVDTGRATGRRLPSLEADFDRVGEVLALIETRVRERLMPGPDLLESAEPLTHLAGAWSLARARDGAWATARLLWMLRRHGEAYEECAGLLDATVALTGRLLLAPLPLPRRRPRPRPRLKQLVPQSSGSTTGAISS
ncbi:DUF5995 family protein [Actinacidiphila acidipaludis]|uniref:DUF5995 family protein n=1 Tax=Actinacidiphila acidipaludis TaxID=2873382 RepID=A0ABS7QE82_9ACTN|nr:DUF5995 family protein [Streptomyces acidipaludis]MBY8880999.1 DUF5995 family protein [Streptomyces acidipaludis]